MLFLFSLKSTMSYWVVGAILEGQWAQNMVSLHPTYQILLGSHRWATEWDVPKVPFALLIWTVQHAHV